MVYLSSIKCWSKTWYGYDCFSRNYFFTLADAILVYKMISKMKSKLKNINYEIEQSKKWN